jgi:hypothetical protein
MHIKGEFGSLQIFFIKWMLNDRELGVASTNRHS